MKRALRISLYIVGAIVIFIVSVFTYVYFNREKILKNITDGLNKKYDAQFLVKDLRTTFFNDFPHFSLTLVETEIKGSRYSEYQIPLLKAEKIFLQVNLLEFFRGNIKVSSFKIKKAAITIFKTKDGYTNNIFKVKEGVPSEDNSGTSSGVDFSIREIMFDDVKFRVTDSVKNNSFDFTLINVKSILKDENNIIHIDTKGDIYFDGLTFKESKGPFIYKQTLQIHWNCLFNRETKNLHIEPNSFLVHDKSIFNLSGNLTFGKRAYLELLIKNKALSYNHATDLLNKNISQQLKKYEFDGTIDTEVLLKTRLDTAGTEPLITINAKANGITVHWKEIDFTTVKFDAVFNNHFDSVKEPGDFNTRVYFNNVQGLIEGIPMTGQFYLQDLKNTQIHADLVSVFKLVDAQHLINPATLIIKGGDASINLNYYGPVNEFTENNIGKLHAFVKGAINVTNGEIRYMKKPFGFTGINVSANFDSCDILLHSVSMSINGNRVSANGFIGQFIPFLLSPTRKIIAKVNASCPFMNLASLIIAKPATTVEPEAPEYKGPGVTVKKTKVAVIIDQLIQSTEIDAQLQADKMIYKSLIADKISGTVAIHNNDITVKKLRFRNSNGEFLIDGMLNHKDELSAQVKIDHADAKLIFKSFDNFNQDRFRDNNIEGKLSAEVDYSCRLNSQMQIRPESMRGVLSVNFKDGKLIDCFALGSIGKIVFNEENLNYLEFDEIKSHSTLNGFDLKIERLDLVSSFMGLIIEGVYSFSTNTDLSIQVPVANLKKKKGKYQLTTAQLDNYDGANIYLRARPDVNNKLSITYDPFKKRREKK